MGCISLSASTNQDRRVFGNDQANSANGIGVDEAPAGQFRLLGNFGFPFVGTRSANTRTMFGCGLGTNNTFWFQDGARTALTNASYQTTANTICPIGSSDTTTALGVHSFMVAFDGVTTTSSLLSSFYNLYRQTLGTGLGLP
jgi:hypothetical protein